MSRGLRRKNSRASSPGPGSPAPDAGGPGGRLFGRPRTSTVVLAVLFVAVAALWVVLPTVPKPASDGQTGYNSSGSGSGQGPGATPPPTTTPTYQPAPTRSPSPTRTPTRTATPTPTRTPGQTPTQSPSPTTSGTGQVPVSPTAGQQSPAPASGSTGGAAAGSSSPPPGGTQAPAGVNVGVQTP